jgi:hypothetical protein
MESLRAKLHDFLKERLSQEGTLYEGFDRNRPFEVHSLRPTQRTGAGGEAVAQWVIEVAQRRAEYLDGQPPPPGENPDDSREQFWFRGGCTWIVEADTGTVRYAIGKNINSAARLERQRKFLTEVSGQSLRATYFGSVGKDGHAEPFALLHRDYEGRRVRR